MLSHVVMSDVQVFPSLWCWVWLVSLWECYGLPSVEMWVDCGGVRCCGLSKVGMVGMVEIRQVMWIVILKFAKDWVLGVDTLGQQVLACVRYGTVCLLIRDAVGSVACLVEWEIVIPNFYAITKYSSYASNHNIEPHHGQLTSRWMEDHNTLTKTQAKLNKTKDGKTCMTPMTAWLRKTNQVWTQILKYEV
jgi:hypothetical protein